ncbi:MAG: methyltransferase, partial [Acidobacteriota bacterium]
MSQLPPDVRVSRLASAYQLSRAVQVAARLDLGRLLANGPRTARELADATATDHVVLARLLRFLAELEV